MLLMEVSNAGTAQEAQDLYVMSADGSQTRLTSDGRTGDGSFSPDGAKVVFSRTDDGLYVVDPSADRQVVLGVVVGDPGLVSRWLAYRIHRLSGRRSGWTHI